jgi:hypothetical protein
MYMPIIFKDMRSNIMDFICSFGFQARLKAHPKHAGREDETHYNLCGISALALESVVTNASLLGRARESKGFRAVGITPSELSRLTGERGEPWLIKSIPKHHGRSVAGLAILDYSQGVAPEHLTVLIESSELVSASKNVWLRFAVFTENEAVECARAISSILDRASGLESLVLFLDIGMDHKMTQDLVNSFLFSDGPPSTSTTSLELRARFSTPHHPTEAWSAQRSCTRRPSPAASRTSNHWGSNLLWTFFSGTDTEWTASLSATVSALPPSLTNLTYCAPWAFQAAHTFEGLGDRLPLLENAALWIAPIWSPMRPAKPIAGLLRRGWPTALRIGLRWERLREQARQS